MTSHFSADNTLPLVEQTPQRQISDSSNPIDKIAEVIASIASQQQPQTSSALFKPTTTYSLIFEGENGKIELFEDRFQTMLKLQPEKSEARKIIHFHSHLREDALQIFRNSFAGTNEHFKTYSSYPDKNTSNRNHEPQQNTNGITHF